MTLQPSTRALLGVLLLAALGSGSLSPTAAQAQRASSAQGQTMRAATNDPNFYVGMWVTQNGNIRHELLPGGRYDEARCNWQNAYRGRYVVKGDHIDYVEDTGFTADGEFRDGLLYHAGIVLYRRQRP